MIAIVVIQALLKRASSSRCDGTESGKYVVHYVDHYYAMRVRMDSWDLRDKRMHVELPMSVMMECRFGPQTRFYKLEDLHTECCPLRLVQCLQCGDVMRNLQGLAHNCRHSGRRCTMQDVHGLSRKQGECPCQMPGSILRNLSNKDDAIGGVSSEQPPSNSSHATHACGCSRRIAHVCEPICQAMLGCDGTCHSRSPDGSGHPPTPAPAVHKSAEHSSSELSTTTSPAKLQVPEQVPTASNLSKASTAPAESTSTATLTALPTQLTAQTTSPPSEGPVAGKRTRRAYTKDRLDAAAAAAQRQVGEQDAFCDIATMSCTYDLKRSHFA